jgi:hypothetical protein
MLDAESALLVNTALKALLLQLVTVLKDITVNKAQLHLLEAPLTQSSAPLVLMPPLEFLE